MKAIFEKLIFVLVVTLVGCSSEVATPTAIPTSTTTPDPVSLKLNWRHGIQFLGFYVAQEKGFYAEEGLAINVEAIEETSEVGTLPEVVATGDFDFSMGAGLIVSGQARGTPITVIGTVLQLSPNTFFAHADSGIITPADFAGRTIAIKSQIGRDNLAQLLVTVNLTLDDVIQIDVGFDMTPFYEGEVDVWAGFLNDEVIRARQRDLELVTFPLHEYGIEGTSVALFTSQEQLENNPQLSERFLRASLRGWQWAVDNPTDAVDTMLEIFPEMADERDFHLASFNAYIPLVQVPGTPIGTPDCEDWVSDARFEALDSTENLCTTEIFESATVQEN